MPCALIDFNIRYSMIFTGVEFNMHTLNVGYTRSFVSMSAGKARNDNLSINHHSSFFSEEQ